MGEILRIKKHDKNFVVLDKTFIEDERLSWKAKGILAYLLSRPDRWDVRPEELAKHSKDGITVVYSALKELTQYGYYKKIPIRDENARILCWESTVSEIPMTDEEPNTDKKTVKKTTKKSAASQGEISVDTEDSNNIETADNNIVVAEEKSDIIDCVASETKEFDVVFPHSENLKVGNVNLRNTDNNKYINKINNENNKKYCASDDAPRSFENFFEMAWASYPKKRGKGKILDKQKKHLHELGQEFLRALERYKAELEIETWKQPQNGDTFFMRGYIDYLDKNYTPLPSRTPSMPKKNTFNDFPQREYDYDELERLLLTTSI